MAKLWNKLINSFTIKNATSSRGSGGTINRDPKAIQVKRIGYQFVEGGGGRDSFEEPIANYELIDNAIQRDSYIMQSMMKYSELIFKSGWQLKGKNEQSLEYLQQRLDMMAVATGVPTEELFQGIADDIVRYANCFIVKAPARNGVGLPPGLSAIPIPPRKDPIGGYFRLPPHSISIARDANGNVLKYRQEIEGGDDPIEFNPHDVIHIYVNRPVGRAFGEPWIAPVLEDVRLLRKIEENASLLLHRHIFPLIAYTVGLPEPGKEASDEEIEELQAVIGSMPTDGAIVLPERHKVEAVKIDTIEIRPYLDYFEQRVFTGLGMSTVDMGRGDTANRNTADAMGGIKADRVKGWQKSLQIQIDKYLIDEILVEGGFDPLSNPEYDVNFEFEEIEQEKKIAKENHALAKWNSNIATFEETRHEIGYDPVADESRLMFVMTGSATSETEREVDNKNAPENQNGKRTAPKSGTEFSETVSSPFSGRQEELYKYLLSQHQTIEKDVTEALEKEMSEQAFPQKEPTIHLQSMYFSKEKSIRKIQEHARSMLFEGMTKARDDLGRNKYPNVDVEKANHTIKEYAQESLDRLENSIKDMLSTKLEACENKEDVLLAVKGVFSSTSYRLSLMSKTMVAKSFHYGYALSLMKSGEQYMQSVHEGNCAVCQSKADRPIDLQQHGSLSEISIFYQIPPWHPECDCYLTTFEGGEK